MITAITDGGGAAANTHRVNTDNERDYIRAIRVNRAWNRVVPTGMAATGRAVVQATAWAVQRPYDWCYTVSVVCCKHA